MRASKLLSLSFGSLIRIAVLQDSTQSRILMRSAIDLYELLVQSWWRGGGRNLQGGFQEWQPSWGVLSFVQSSPPLSNLYLPLWYNPVSYNQNKYRKVGYKKMKNMCSQSWSDKMLGVAEAYSEEQADWNSETH